MSENSPESPRSEVAGAGSWVPPWLAAPRTLQWHFVAYLVVNGLALFAAGGAVWLLPAAWGLVLLAHFLAFKTGSVSEEWGEAWTARIRRKSYDHRHISDIVESSERDHETDPAAPRRE